MILRDFEIGIQHSQAHINHHMFHNIRLLSFSMCVFREKCFCVFTNRNPVFTIGSRLLQFRILTQEDVSIHLICGYFQILYFRMKANTTVNRLKLDFPLETYCVTEQINNARLNKVQKNLISWQSNSKSRYRSLDAIITFNFKSVAFFTY